MEIMEAIKNRRSVRAYDPRPIEPASYQRLRDALRFAPSACNFQPWRFILVEDTQMKANIAEASNGQTWMAQAPLIVVACGFPVQAYKKMGGYFNSVDIDLAIALDHLSLVAAGDGLGTCWIGAFDEQAIKKLLEIPKEVKIVALMPVGYPAGPDLIRPLNEEKRKPEKEIFNLNTYV
jgi:nitroreductase